ncbi:PA0069 family radical SAM protein [Halomonas sp. MCCC 1A11062]|uniref:PA0069 family radical SAM protein n=1 Tax=Halomonas sp. MCCC 1A11062 TaxID=2733485 RepID=UPI001F2874E5|nr:PA0069 family radical SAM protein [Halomonas sp. MCCC 1A11062]MCE8039477.1 PA0069 family radical SAM protein [Halomonas sp. MCCC 1A11062]
MPHFDIKQTRKGRGATYNPSNRFAPTHSETVDDGWWQEEMPTRLATVVSEERARSALAWNDSPDLAFDRSLNPYRGCEHGCIYCYARPSHAYWDMSPGIDFETRLIARSGLVDRLREEFCKRSYVCRPIAFSGNTDCYQPLEAERGTSREILGFLLECRHPVSIITKSALILRDLDLLGELARQRLVRVSISLTSLDTQLKRSLEPRAASPAARLRTVQRLHAAGIPVGVMVAPVIPGLTDHELDGLLAAARDAGAQWAGWTLLRLPREVAPLFEDWLAAHYPERARKVMSLVRQSRGGADYDSRFGKRMRGEGVFAELIAQRFDKICRRLGLNDPDKREARQLDTTAFRPPRKQGDLFD